MRYDRDALYTEEAMAVHVLMTEDKRTMQIITVMGNSMHGLIQLEYNCASLHDDKRMPIRNSKVRVNGKNHIRQEFNTKDVSSKSVIQHFQMISRGPYAHKKASQISVKHCHGM